MKQITTLEEAMRVIDKHPKTMTLLVGTFLGVVGFIDGAGVKSAFAAIKQPISDHAASELARWIMAAKPKDF